MSRRKGLAFPIRALGALLVLAGAVESRARPTLRGPTPAAESAAAPDFTRLTARAAETGSSALLVSRHGKLLLDRRFGDAPARMSVQSVTKSVDALAIGRLIADGRIGSLDAPASAWFPEWAADAGKSRITLRMLMDHTSGLPDPAEFFAGGPQDLVAKARALPLVAPPGAKFIYSNPGVQLLAPIIAAAAGEPADAYIEHILFKPMGIADWAWNRDGAGNVATPGGLWLEPGDLLKLGNLMLQGGAWEGQRLVPEAWVRLVTLPSQALRPDYGLLWWRTGKATYFAQGWQGQFIVVAPAAGIVAVRTRGIPADPLAQGEQDQATSFLDFPGLIEELATGY